VPSELRAAHLNEFAGRAGQLNLAVASGHHPRRQMNIKADVLGRVDARLAHLNTNSQPDRSRFELAHRLCVTAATASPADWNA